MSEPADPFRITGPATIAFSGGRTSAYMLRRILDAHGGALPPDVLVLFQNTGREMPATLDFVRDCAAAWNVDVIWLEYRRDPATGRRWAERVSHNSASRNGEPFDAMLAAKSTLPNPVARFCSIELKIRTAYRYVRDALGWDRWTNVVGLRADEPARVRRLHARNAEGKDRWRAIAPLFDAGVQEIDVLDFWRGQPFDLRLAGRWEGNCDGCFLKNRGALSRMFRDHPGRMAWWAEQEAAPRGNGAGALFRIDREPYEAIGRLTRDQGVLPFALVDPNQLDCSEGCGT